MIGVDAVASIAIVRLASRHVHEAIGAQLSTMRQILKGDLSAQWSPRRPDEFLDLGAGCNEMLLGLREREKPKDIWSICVEGRSGSDLGLETPTWRRAAGRYGVVSRLRGFSTLSEKTPPKVLLQMLNVFFTQMVAGLKRMAA